MVEDARGKEERGCRLLSQIPPQFPVWIGSPGALTLGVRKVVAEAQAASRWFLDAQSEAVCCGFLAVSCILHRLPRPAWRVAKIGPMTTGSTDGSLGDAANGVHCASWFRQNSQRADRGPKRALPGRPGTREGAPVRGERGSRIGNAPIDSLMRRAQGGAPRRARQPGMRDHDRSGSQAGTPHVITARSQ